MKLTSDHFKSLPENLFLVLLVASNFTALYFLGIGLLFNVFPFNKYTRIEMYLIMAGGGFIIKLIFFTYIIRVRSSV